MQKTIYKVIIAVACIIIVSAPAFAGYLTFVEIKRDDTSRVDGLWHATSVTVSPDGKHVYATGSSDNAVAVFSRDASTGRLTFVEVQKDGVNGVDGLWQAKSVTVSPDGKHVYATSRYVDNAVAVFSRDAITGQLTFVEVQKDGVNGVDGLNYADNVTVSPDGKHVYVTGYADDAVTVFSRDATSGQLTFVEVNELDFANGATVSPDGKHIYAIDGHTGAVTVFSRDASSGQLTGVDSIDVLDGANSVKVSPDGKHVYATGSSGNAVTVFSRDASTGRLTFVEVQKDGVNGVDGLDSPNSVTISPDGKHVFATSWNDDSVVVFNRDATSGQLTFVEYEKDGYGVEGLDGANSATVSPDGNHIYATGLYDNSVAVFQIHQNIFTAPTVTTDSTFAIGLTAATSGGTVTTDGGAYVFTRGVCWSTFSNPTISDSKTEDGSGTGTFKSFITGLTPLTTYYVRAYATYSAGISYGNAVTIITNPNIFGMAVGNQWLYDSNIQRKITKINLTFPKFTFEMEILENGVLTGKEWYETTNNQLLIWGTDSSSIFIFDKGLLAAWVPLSVGEQKHSSAAVVGYPGTTVDMTVDVLSFEKLSLGIGTFDAYRLRYNFTATGPGGTSGQTYDWWIVPYLGVVKQQTPGGEEELISFAIYDGNITEISDNDDDDLLDYLELFAYNTDPYDSDSDDDGFTDGEEVNHHGTDPNDPYSHPSTAMPCIPLLLLDD